MPREYAFRDEFEVAAPVDAVFEVLADGGSYPLWWQSLELEVEVDGHARVGQEGRQQFAARLPYKLRTTTVMTRYEPPLVLAVDVDGDLKGSGTWTLSARSDGRTRVGFELRVQPAHRVLRFLSPLLAPAYRWNHAWAMDRARAGLVEYAGRT